MTVDDRVSLERLQDDFPGWHVWRARTATGEAGTWWATRRDRVLTTEEMRAGLAHTVAGDTADELRDALVGQRDIESTRV
ncbi:hypothetical protein [Actinomadura alba]|uniref:Uncharacterized protein n=1 Tax=Actinomadura alba TaxID=406431 RepID=A0ABR7M222_9ACTN|nr:hypothetical protein [Actinomadura alba]MBC6471060.1 hypothetical protein [Actinomadura alba]